MPHRRMSHAYRRRCYVVFQPDEGTDNHVSTDFDDVRYDDLMPRAHRLRGALVLDDDGDPAAPTDLIRDDVRV